MFKLLFDKRIWIGKNIFETIFSCIINIGVLIWTIAWMSVFGIVLLFLANVMFATIVTGGHLVVNI